MVGGGDDTNLKVCFQGGYPVQFKLTPKRFLETFKCEPLNWFRQYEECTRSDAVLLKTCESQLFLIRPSPKGRPLQECRSVVCLSVCCRGHSLRLGMSG